MPGSGTLSGLRTPGGGPEPGFRTPGGSAELGGFTPRGSDACVLDALGVGLLCPGNGMLLSTCTEPRDPGLGGLMPGFGAGAEPGGRTPGGGALPPPSLPLPPGSMTPGGGVRRLCLPL